MMYSTYVCDACKKKDRCDFVTNMKFEWIKIVYGNLDEDVDTYHACSRVCAAKILAKMSKNVWEHSMP
jgi:hypothetical protein